MEGRRLLNVNWDDGPNKELNTAKVMDVPEAGRSKERCEFIFGGRCFEGRGPKSFG
jgi:hypothetical protein